jgi:putative ABC transport system permease protein
MIALAGWARRGKRMTHAGPQSRDARRVDPLWRKAPAALLRSPSLFTALVLGSFLLTIAAAAYPLFTSSTATDLLNGIIARPAVTRYGAGIRYQTDDSYPLRERDLARFGLPGHGGLDGLFARAYARATEGADLGPIERSVLGPQVGIASAASRTEPLTGRVFAGTGALEHVHVIARQPGSGVWLPDVIANPLGIGPGDAISLEGPDGSPLRRQVAGVYRNLDETSLPGYWQMWSSVLHRSPEGALPPELILVEEKDVLALSRELGARYAGFGWQAPLAPGRELDLDEARKADQSIALLADRLRYRSPPGYIDQVASSLSGVIREVDRHLATIEGPGRLLRGAGIVVALVVAASAPAFALGARRTEVHLLNARGEGPLAVAARSCLESVLPCLAGVGLGLGSVFVLLATVGPGGGVTPVASREAFVGAATAGAASVILFGLVAGVAFQRESRLRRSHGRLLRHLPWELTLLPLAYVSWRILQRSGAIVVDPASGVDRPSLLLVIFPLLLLGGLSVVGARLFRGVALIARKRSRRLSHAVYLASHRLARGSGVTLLLVALTAFCLGVFVQAETAIQSLRLTVAAKSQAFVGSDVQARVDYATPVPDPFAFPLTRASRLLDAGTLSGGATFDLLTVDATTLAGVAYWNDAFSSASIETIASSLGSTPAGSLPIVVAGDSPGDTSSIEVARQVMAVRVVATATAFPGMSSRRPLVVADEDAFLGAFEGGLNPLHQPRATTEFWIRGDEGAITNALRELRHQPEFVFTDSEVRDIPYISAAIGTFVILEVLGLVAALLVMAGTLLYLQARERSQVVSYGLSLRMGLDHGGHRRALVYELGAILGSSYAVAVVLALTVALLVVPKLDPLPVIPPVPLLIMPIWALVFGVGGIAILAVVGGWLTNLRARRVDLGWVMRTAE